MAARIVPITRLRRRYVGLADRGVGMAKRSEECKALTLNVRPLVDEYLEALRDLELYDNRNEGFRPESGRLDPADRTRDAGTVIVTERLAGGRITVPKLPGYAFTFVDREINPLRTTGGTFSDGTLATRTGKGGLDYIGRVDGTPPIPILGEIKVGSDKDPYYAFVQLLTYLSEFSTANQFARASEHFFDGVLTHPTAFDLHILLVDFNDRGVGGPLIESTRDIVRAFKSHLAERPGAISAIGRVLCLRTTVESLKRSLDLDLAWEA